MDNYMNKTYDKSGSVKRGFWISMDDTNSSRPEDDMLSTTTTAESANKTHTIGNTEYTMDYRRGGGGGFNWIPIEINTAVTNDDDDQYHDLENEQRTRPMKKQKNFGLSWVPLGENSVNVNNNDSDNTAADHKFSVPQRLPMKIKKKLTPAKVATPVRRTSLNSLRRETFRVSPKSRTPLNLMSNTIIKTKKRRSSGSSGASFILTPRNKSAIIQSLSTPSKSATKSYFGIEDIQYMSWCNTMLAPKVDDKNDKIDCNLLIMDCFNSTKVEITVCPTKEQMSAQTYRESLKWNSLRSTALALYQSNDVKRVNSKMLADIHNSKFAVRKDRAIHADIGFRKHIIDLLLSYNPLWLRIGLETIYNNKIEMTTNSSNQMRLILGKFIAQNLLVSKELIAKYGHKTVVNFFKDDHHILEAKKYILIKFLNLLNFLDAAKQRRLIEHNPCLFRHSATNKSTVDLIISFARDYITGVGDITKYLRSIGFSLNYKQTPIEEYDFQVENLAIDFRDGIRLARLAELCTEHKQLLSKLLYPSNNITRKLHNIDVALKAFDQIVPNGISPKDIVYGHRKKTFALLDAIIFKHKEDELLAEEQLREQSAIVIQRLFRANRLMIKDRQYFQSLKRSAVLIQRKFRANRCTKGEEYHQYITIKRSAIFIQRWFRKNKLMKEERQQYLTLRKTAIWMQMKIRSNRLMRQQRNRYLNLKTAVIRTQSIFRANKLMSRDRQQYQSLKRSAIVIQQWFRANRLMREKMEQYIMLKKSTLWVQMQFRSNRLMRQERENYLSLKSTVIWTQNMFRANKLMSRDHQQYQSLKRSAIVIQQWFRANRLMREKREQYIMLKKSTLWVQMQFRSNRLMRQERDNYLNLKTAVIRIQSMFRANQLMSKDRQQYQSLKRSAIVIQRWFRKNKLMKEERQQYLTLKKTAIWMQMKIRSNLQTRQQRNHYLNLKTAVIRTQSIFRANKMMLRDRQQYQSLKRSTIVIQQWFRANRLMREKMEQYIMLKKSTLWVQMQFRSNRLMRQERDNYLNFKTAVIRIQNMFRANQLMSKDRQQYQSLKRSAIVIQRWFRANRLMREKREQYIMLKKSTICVQMQFRANQLMSKDRQQYQSLKRSTIVIQRRFRANRVMRQMREQYITLKKSTIWVQMQFRANRLMRQERENYLRLKSTVIWTQNMFRANQLMSKDRQQYQSLKRSTIVIQRWFRSNKDMRQERKQYLILKKTTIWVQKIFRSNRQMKYDRQHFVQLRQSVILIQRRFRDKLVDFRTKRAAIKIQSFWRGYKTRKQIHEENAKIQLAFQRILTSTSLATKDMQLGNRTQNALQKLLAYDSLLHLAYDLSALDRTTKLSPVSCETLVLYGAVKILIQILNESNRSEPHKQIVVLTVNILLNLAKYEKTLANLVNNSQTIDILFRIIKNFSRCPQLICKCFTLLSILLNNKVLFEHVMSDTRKICAIKQISDAFKKDKSFKKYRLKSVYKFWPNWQIAKSNVYEFDNHFLAIQVIARLLKID
ncbi:protein abnormal spindle-like [Oppia nitens]|uniref:protein abnormal spindle-like n=1 Tax=Oppia nitens TaxID=1686743 RepID=UPI0023DAF280|nr:protein abnormal spindle-like [Oppia nitens]